MEQENNPNLQNPFDQNIGKGEIKDSELVSEILIFIFCVVSLMATIWVISRLNYERKFQNISYAQKIITMICITDGIWSLNIIWSLIYVWTSEQKTLSDTACSVQGFFKVYYDLSQIVWIFWLVYTIYYSICKEETYKCNDSIRSKVFWTNLFIIGCASIGLITNSYTDYVIYFENDEFQQHQNINCYLAFYKTSDNGIETYPCLDLPGMSKLGCIMGTVLRVVLILIPTPLLIGFIYFVYTQVNIKLEQQEFKDSRTFIGEKDRKELNKFMLTYPGILFAFWIVLYLIRFFETIDVSIGGPQVLYFGFVSGYVLVTAMGIANSINFGLNLNAGIMKSADEQQNFKNTSWFEKDSGKISFLQSGMSLLEGSTQ